MSQAIITKFIGPHLGLGGHIKASAWAGSVVIPYDYSGDEAHRQAASALIAKLDWPPLSSWREGGTPDGSGFAFVLIA